MNRIIAVFIALAMMLTVFAFADESELTVKGTGTVSMAADIATITIGVQNIETDVATAQAVTNEAINSMLTALTEAGVAESDIATGSIYIYAEYDYSEAVERIVGYRASNTLVVRTRDITSVGNLIDIAFAAGANTLEDVSFYASDASEASEQALRNAVADAMNRAAIVADAAGVSLGSILTIEESISTPSDSNGRMFAMAAEAAAEDASGTVVQAGQLQVTANVTMTYEISEPRG
ncbi:MAG: SIMPL domain-containing protein [Clostridia bacterium]|nr:SIMPL domain-containing protein [Clostridia bacterium]